MRSLVIVALVVAAAAQPAAAQDYYRGKTITLFAGQPPGGGIDLEMRLVGQFYGKHIPGGPSIVPRNMPGAGGLILGNHLYSVAQAGRPHARHARPHRLRAGADHQRRRHQI